jgi:hypothetical protein
MPADPYEEWYYQSGKAEADWAEFIDDMFQLANQEDKETP